MLLNFYGRTKKADNTAYNPLYFELNGYSSFSSCLLNHLEKKNSFMYYVSEDILEFIRILE